MKRSVLITLLVLLLAQYARCDEQIYFWNGYDAYSVSNVTNLNLVEQKLNKMLSGFKNITQKN